MIVKKGDIRNFVFILTIFLSFIGETNLAIISAVGLIVISNNSLALDKNLLYSVLFCLFVITSYLWVGYHSVTSLANYRSILIVMILSIVLLYWMNSNVLTLDDLDKIIQAYIVFATFVLIYVVLKTPTSEWGVIRIGETAGFNENTLGMMFSWGTVFCLYYIVHKRSVFIHLTLAFGFTVVSLLSGSRKALLCILLVVTLYVLIKGGTSKFIRNILLVLLILTGTIYFLMNNEVLYTIIGNRFETLFISTFLDSSYGANDIGSRSFLRATAYKAFFQNPVWGLGFDGFRYYLKNTVGYYISMYSHCNYSEVLADYGLIGAILFYLPRISNLRYLWKKRLYKRYDLVLLLFVCFVVQIIMEYGYVSYSDLISLLLFAMLARCASTNLILNNESEVYYE